MHRLMVDASFNVMMTAVMGRAHIVRIYTFGSASVTFLEIASLLYHSRTVSSSFGLQ